MAPGDESVVNGLTPLGLAEARLVAARLAGMPVTFQTLVSSTFTRARQTAQVIGQSLPRLTLQTTPLLCECLPRMRSAEAMQRAGTAELDAAEKQLNEAFATYFVPAKDADENDILVCHGNVIRYFVTKALGVDTQAWAGFAVAHCSLTVIRVSPGGGCQVVSVGDIGHIPPDLQSGASRKTPELVAP
jgi:serine/threonine-protein phosphatase PGAM5